MKQRSAIGIILFTVFLDLLGFGILIPLLPYIAQDYGASGFMVGLLMATYSVAQFLFAPVWGRISDLFGRRPVILVSLVGSTVGYALFAIAPSLEWLFVSRLLSGIAAANISTANAAIADLLPPEKRTAGMGMIGAAIGLGFVFGPGLAGVMVGESGSYTLPFVVASLLSGIDLVLAWFFFPETLNREQPREREKRFTSDMLSYSIRAPFIGTLLLSSLIYYTAFSAMESTFALYINGEFDIGARGNSFLLLMVGIVLVIVQGGLVGRASKWLGDRPLLISGLAGLVVGLVCMSIAPTVPLLIAAVLVLAVSAGFSGPTLTSMISRISASNVQGSVLGLHQSMASLGRIFGPLLGTAAFDWISPSSPFWIGGILVTIAIFLLLPLVFHPESSPDERNKPEADSYSTE